MERQKTKRKRSDRSNCCAEDSLRDTKKKCTKDFKPLHDNNGKVSDTKPESTQKEVKTGCDSKNTKHISGKRQKDRLKRNKKMFKKKHKVKEEENKSEKNETVHLPSKPEEFSSNWEKLKQKIQPNGNSRSKKAKMSEVSHVTKFSKGKQKQEEQTEPEKPPDIWFDDVDELLLDNPPEIPAVVKTNKKHTIDPLVKIGSPSGLTRAVAIDCEMVGVGYNSKQDMLARVSVVNHFGHCIYDTFVKPMEKVTDYRTHVSGVREEDLNKGVEFSVVCKQVADLIKGRILVGHAIRNDLKVLFLSHPKKMVRDTSKYKPFKHLFDGKTPSLKKLTAKVLGVAVQEGEHSSIQDAQAAMRLYTMHKQQWEKELALKYPKRQKKLGKKKIKMKQNL